MSEATATAEPTEVVISDGSHLAEGSGVRQRLNNALKKGVEAIIALPAAMKTTANLFKTVAESRAIARSLILLDDEQPDWTGGSQTYKQEVNLREADAFKSYSDSEKRSVDSNVRSHMRRGILDSVILAYVRAHNVNIKDLADDSPTVKALMRAQYARTTTQPNPIACPDKWQDTAPTPDTPGNGAKTEDTPTAKVNAAAIALTSMGGVGAVSHLHDMASKLGAAQTAPNAEINGGRKLAGDAWLDLSNYCEAVSRILSDANLTGDKFEAALAVVSKYSYKG
jgi:hypothetical protein